MKYAKLCDIKLHRSQETCIYVHGFGLSVPNVPKYIWLWQVRWHTSGLEQPGFAYINTSKPEALFTKRTDALP